MSLIKGIHQRTSTVNLKLDVFFYFNNSVVQTVKIDSVKESDGYESFSSTIQVTIEFELDEFESVSDAPIKARPHLLSTLGILSFISNYPFDVFGREAHSIVEPSGVSKLVDNKSNRLIINDYDLTDELSQLLEKIDLQTQPELNLTFSLLDRWRKAFYLEKGNASNLLYHDEALLAYFHVLELLTTAYKSQLVHNAETLIDHFVNEFNTNILFVEDDNILEQENNSKRKILKELLTNNLPIGPRLL